jgi:hypothetical protein
LPIQQCSSELQARGVMPEHLPMIATMPRLAHLSLKRCRGVTNACLADLAPLTGLSSLSLARCYQVLLHVHFISALSCVFFQSMRAQTQKGMASGHYSGLANCSL